MTEADHMELFFQLVRDYRGKWPELHNCFHVPNGGARPALTVYSKKLRRNIRISREMQKLKRQGLENGVPDIFLDVARRGFHGLRIEMKTEQGSASEDQRDWIARLRAEGYAAIVCKGYRAAWKYVLWYIGVDQQIIDRWHFNLWAERG